MKSEKQTLSKEALIFKRFIISAIVFVVAMITITYSNLLIEPSIKQELLAAVSLVLAVPSGTFALYYYVRFLLSRFEQFKNR